MSGFVLVLHQAVDVNSPADEADVLVQVAAVVSALQELGYAAEAFPCTLNLEAVRLHLLQKQPQVVFNLVESIAGCDGLAPLVVDLLEALGVPFTGAGSEAMRLHNDKLRSKERLQQAGLPTPPWHNGPQTIEYPRRMIIKPLHLHASAGVDEAAILDAQSGAQLATAIEERSRSLNTPCFAEAFIAGREFNLSVIAGPNGLVPLPPAEIDFSAFPGGKPQIVGYAAKWDETSFEYQHTPRRFDFLPGDQSLLSQLQILAVKAFHAFNLRGYGRVDFRVDEQGQPWILEVNANPCLSPDAGFAAALERSRLSYSAALQQILNAATHQRPKSLKFAAPAVASFKPCLQPPAAPQSSRPSRPEINLRYEPQLADIAAVRQIVASTGMFRPGEIDVAAELVEARLQRGGASGYEFVFAERDGVVLAYVCFGRNTLTVSSFDLYWIAVEESLRGQGLGGILLREAERLSALAGATRLYIETSHRPDYADTRRFYERNGYQLAALLPDFYAAGDDRAIFVRSLGD